MASQRPTLDNYRAGSLIQPMLINALLHIQPEGHREGARLGPLFRPSAKWGLNQEPSDSDFNALIH